VFQYKSNKTGSSKMGKMSGRTGKTGLADVIQNKSNLDTVRMIMLEDEPWSAPTGVLPELEPPVSAAPAESALGKHFWSNLAGNVAFSGALALSAVQAQQRYAEANSRVGVQSDPGGNMTLLAEHPMQNTGRGGQDDLAKFLRSIDQNIRSVVNDGLRLRESGARIGMKL